MHQPIREGLESYLAGRPEPGFVAHLASCGACREEVGEMARHSELLQLLRPPEPFDPAPGFYARVMERVEAERRQSFWYLFLEPVFARRLMYASFTLLILLSAFLFTTGGEPEPAWARTPEYIMAEEAPPPVMVVDGQQDRDVVLVQLTTYQE